MIRRRTLTTGATDQTELAAPSRARTKREHMVASQLARRSVTDERVLEAMREVPREAFVGTPANDSRTGCNAQAVGESRSLYDLI